MEHLTLEQRTTHHLLREQGEALVMVKTRLDNGLWVRKDNLAKAIGDAVAAHIGSCPGAKIEETLEKYSKRRREGFLDRVAWVGLLVRSLATACGLVGALAAAKAMGLF